MFSTSVTGDVRPRFEYYPLDSPKLHTIDIDDFPFIIGRSASASFQINSTSVSREHAEVVRTPTGFCLRDLGSTNGTCRNGTPVREAPLVDGDSVSIADIELTFVCTSMGRLQRTLTKPLPRKKPVGVVPGTTPELAAARTLNEALLLQVIPLNWSYLADTTTGGALMTVSRVMAPLDETMGQADAKLPSRAASRLELLGWQLGVEQYQTHAGAGPLLLGVVHRESLDQRLPEALLELEDSLPSVPELGVCVPWEWATATPDSMRLVARLREQGRLVVFDEFSGGSGSVSSMDMATPDYLLLSKQVTQDIAQQPRRLQRLEIVLAECASRGVDVALGAGISEEDKLACHELGITIAQQSSPQVAPQYLAGAPV